MAERQIPHGVQVLLLLGFAGAFLVKLPVPPLHAWLPDAHTQAPTAGSILLAGLLLKTGAYGLFRFPPMLFPEGFATLAPFGLALGAFGSIYGALLACGQTDAKRLVAYTSVAHMSIVLMGICGGVYFSLMGAGVEMVAHAFSASALFLLIGALYDRTGTRDLRELGGLQQNAPRFAAAFAVFFSAALAMPGTANFLGEALVITGMFQVNWIFASITLISLVVSVVYATRLFKRVVFGTSRRTAALEDLTLREMGPIVLPRRGHAALRDAAADADGRARRRGRGGPYVGDGSLMPSFPALVPVILLGVGAVAAMLAAPACPASRAGSRERRSSARASHSRCGSAHLQASRSCWPTTGWHASRGSASASRVWAALPSCARLVPRRRGRRFSFSPRSGARCSRAPSMRRPFSSGSSSSRWPSSRSSSCRSTGPRSRRATSS